MHSGARILVVDDDEVARSAVVAFLDRQDDLEVVADAADGLEATRRYAELRPDVVLMDLNMPVMSGVEATRAICADHPGACVVALTTFDAGEHVVAALRAGAAGYLLKDSPPQAILEAIRQARDGDMPLSPAVRRALVSSVVMEASPRRSTPQVTLTPRQAELVGWLAHGFTNQQIAGRMHLSEGSVKQYLLQIGTRLGVSTRTQILVRAVQLGIVDPRDAVSIDSL